MNKKNHQGTSWLPKLVLVLCLLIGGGVVISAGRANASPPNLSSSINQPAINFFHFDSGRLDDPNLPPEKAHALATEAAQIQQDASQNKPQH